MKIGATVVESEGQGYQQVVRLQTGLYGGMFSRYTAPKMMTKFQSEEQEEKFFVSFVVTHDAAARPLPYYSEAFAGVRTKAFYDAGTGMKSTFVAFWEALMNGKMTPEEIVEAAEANELPDLDDKIAQPVRLFIVKGEKPGRDGNYSNKIDTGRGGFEKADREFARAVLPLYNAHDAKYSDAGLRYLTSPSPVYQTDVPAEYIGRDGLLTTSPAGGADEEEIPF